MTAKFMEAPKGGVNWRLPGYHKDMKARNQCVTLQNFRYKDEFIDTIPGTKKFHGTSMGSYPVSAIMQYYNDQTGEFRLLAACGGSIYKRDPVTNEMTALIGGLVPNTIFGADQRYEVLYIPSTKDGLKKYLGGNQIETVGGGSTAPGNFRQVLYMKEIDRLFGISDDAIEGQISWCDYGEPEIWDGANIERFKLKKGERVEGGAVLYGKLIIFCTYSIWIYYVQGNEENWRLEEAPTQVGCVAPNTIKKDGRRILFLGESPEYDLGVYSFDGTTSTLLTDDMTPFFENVNRNKLRNACAEIHSSLYTISVAYGFSETNDVSLDLDLLNSKEDGTPAIYGPHTFGFYSACVLNGRQNNKEFLMGGEDDGFIYKEGGTTFNGVDGNDGDLISQRFLSRIDDGEDPNIMKLLGPMNVFFRPTGFFKAKFNYYLSYGAFKNDFTFNPNASFVGFSGYFNILERTLQGTPELYTFQEFPKMKYSVGTAVQFEIVNYIKNNRIAFDGLKYEMENTHANMRVQRYNAN